MTASTDRAPGEATTEGLVLPPTRPDQGAEQDVIDKGVSQVHPDRSLLAQFMDNLMVILGAPHS